MAEELRLVGSFQDNITPKLKKLDREIKAVTKSFTKMQAKLRPIAKDMGTLAMASERVANGLKTQRTGLESNIRALNQYKSSMGKVVSAQKKLKPTALPTPKAPKAPIPGGMPGGFTSGAAMAGAGAFGVTLGSTLSNYIQQGLMMGFDYGRTIIMGAFTKFGEMIGERIEDEMSDIQSAGGMFALDKKQDPSERLFANFTQARNMQELLNRELARSAAALPGATSDYVQSAKQLTDTVFATFAKDKSAFADLAVGLGGKEGGTDTDNITKVLSKFTEQSVLLSQGGGKGGMPLGMLLEQLITMENVNMDSMKRRYAQLRKNPLLANMLKDAEGAINKAGAGTADRFKAVMDALNNALPEEVVNSMRRSVDGVKESIRSAFLDPEVGLLGLGRPLKSTVKSINSFGQFIDKNGKVVRDASDAAEEQTTVFKLLRDIMAGFGLPLSEIATILPQVFDPLEGLADGLFKLRNAAVKFSQMFDSYSNFYKAEGFKDSSIRASLAAFTNFMSGLGGITDVERMANLDMIGQEKVDFKTLVPRILKQILDSPIAEMFGEAIGSVMGNIISTIAQIMTGVINNAETSGLVKGFMKAWNAAGGTDAVKTIFQHIFSMMGKLLLMAVQNFPTEAFVVALIALAPALVAGVTTAFAAALPGMLSGLAGAIGIGGGAAGAGAGGAAVAGGGLVAALAGPLAIAAGVALLAVAAEATEGMRNEFLGNQATGAQSATDRASEAFSAGDDMGGLLAVIQAELMWVVHDFVKGFGDIFTGLYNIVVGLFTNPEMVTKGINQIFSGLWSLFTMIGHLLIALIASIPAVIGILWTAISNLFQGVAGAIGMAAKNVWEAATTMIGGAVNSLFSNIKNAIGNMWTNRPTWLGGTGGESAASSYNGNTSRTMGLGQAIATENKNKPAGSHLVIANSSETVIPAYKGYMPGTAVPAFKGYMDAEPAFAGTVASMPMASNTSQDITVGDITVNVTGADNPTDIANQVADEILRAIKKSTYTEIYST